MAKIIWALSVRQSHESATLIVNTLNNNRKWSKEYEKLFGDLCYSLIMVHEYKKRK